MHVELKHKWTKYCVLSASGNDNETYDDANANRVNFTIKDTQLFVPVVTLSARDNQKVSKLHGKAFERSVYWNEYKTKSDKKNTTNEFRFFLESNFVGVDRLFVLVYTNQYAASKIFKAKWYYLPKETIDNYNVIIFITSSSVENLYDQAIDSDRNWYEEIRK